MRLISLNVALFETNNAQLTQFFSHHPADILCLQEVTRRIDNSAKEAYVSLPAIDKATPNLRSKFFAPNWVVNNFYKQNFHQKAVFKVNYGGPIEVGGYIKANQPMDFAKNVFIQNEFRLITDWSIWPHEDSRGVQIADLKLSHSKKLRVLNYHGIWTQNKLGNSKTLAACQQIKKLATEVGYPAIIAGDFNLFPDTASIAILKKDFLCLVDEYHTPTTRPQSNELSHLPRNVVDYIFVSKQIKVRSFQVPNTTVSDHLPLIMDFEV